jgi:hypothetical protein
MINFQDPWNYIISFLPLIQVFSFDLIQCQDRRLRLSPIRFILYITRQKPTRQLPNMELLSLLAILAMVCGTSTFPAGSLGQSVATVNSRSQDFLQIPSFENEKGSFGSLSLSFSRTDSFSGIGYTNQLYSRQATAMYCWRHQNQPQCLAWAEKWRKWAETHKQADNPFEKRDDNLEPTPEYCWRHHQEPICEAHRNRFRNGVEVKKKNPYPQSNDGQQDDHEQPADSDTANQADTTTSTEATTPSETGDLPLTTTTTTITETETETTTQIGTTSTTVVSIAPVTTVTNTETSTITTTEQETTTTTEQAETMTT